MKRWTRALAVASAIVVAVGLPGGTAGAQGQPAAPDEPVRYEAEDARISRGTVESDHAGFSGRGFVNYASGRGGYVEWTVDAPVNGRYQMYIRYANDSTSVRPARISLNGEPSDTLYFTNTGSWDAWLTYAYTPLLKAGPNRIRLTALTAAGGPNVDWLESAVSSPTTDFEAEDAVISQGTVENEHAGYSGRGYVNSANVAGAYVEWTVDVPSAGFYTIGWVFANATEQDRTTILTINGVVANEEWLFRSVSRSWTRWEETGATFQLDAGPNRIRLTATTADGGPNYDRLLLFTR